MTVDHAAVWTDGS